MASSFGRGFDSLQVHKKKQLIIQLLFLFTGIAGDIAFCLIVIAHYHVVFASFFVFLIHLYDLLHRYFQRSQLAEKLRQLLFLENLLP